MIGRTMVVEGSPVEVLGVTPPGFFGVEVGRSYDVAVPICAEDVLGSEKSWLGDGTIWWLTVMERLPPGRRRIRPAHPAAAPRLGLLCAKNERQVDFADIRDL